jgi:short-subunit dehydrogenase
MKRVLITGTSSGIGRQLAKDYLDTGHYVIACGRDIDKLRTSLGSANEQLNLCRFDLNDRLDVLENTKDIHELDLVILNAGTCEYIDDAKNFNSALFERVIQTNLIGTAYCLEALLPKIKSGGQLAVVSSSASLLPLTRAEAYGASKAGLDYLTRTLAIDLSQHNIDVSLIRPGFVDTPLTQKNTFPMPSLISQTQASAFIIKALNKRQKEITFPKAFYFTLKCMSWLPNNLWHHLAIKMARYQQ